MLSGLPSGIEMGGAKRAARFTSRMSTERSADELRPQILERVNGVAPLSRPWHGRTLLELRAQIGARLSEPQHLHCNHSRRSIDRPTLQERCGSQTPRSTRMAECRIEATDLDLKGCTRLPFRGR